MKNRIRELRKEHGLTLQELSSLVGLGVSTLSGYEKEKGEKGFRNPKIENWQKLADYFGVTVGYLQGKGVTPDEMLNFIVDMFGITRDIINPVTKEKIDNYNFLGELEDDLISDATKKKISVVFPKCLDFYSDEKYTYVSMQDIKEYGFSTIMGHNGLFDDEFFSILVENDCIRKILKKELQENTPLLRDYAFLETFELPPKDGIIKHGVSYLNIEDDAVVVRVYEKILDDYMNTKYKDTKAEAVLYEKNLASDEKSNYGFSILELQDTTHAFSSDIWKYRVITGVHATPLKENSLEKITKLRELSTDIESMITYLKNYQDSVQQYLNKQENSKKD